MRIIPEIRKRLLELAFNVTPLSTPLADELREIEKDLHRRPCVRRAGKRLAMTDTKRQEIKDYAGQFPDMSYQELARALDTNTGRISEVLAGNREAA